MTTFNLADLFEVVADAAPDRLALVAGDCRLTFAQLDERANRVGHALVDAGIKPGDAVAIVCRNRSEWVETMLGCFKCRAVPVNVNYRYVAAEVAYVLENSDARAIVVDQELTPLLVPDGGTPPDLPVFVVPDGSALAPPPGSVALDVAMAASDPSRAFGPRLGTDLYMLYTGGTTGFPKGVMWHLEDLYFAALRGPRTRPLDRPEDIVHPSGSTLGTWLVTTPLMHGNGQWNTLTPLLAGGCAVLWTGRRFDAAAIWQMAAREQVNVVVLAGDAMARPLADELVANRVSYELGHLLAIGSGGAILSGSVKDQLSAALPQVNIADNFGASETGANGVSVGVDGQGRRRFNMGDHITVLDDALQPVEPGSGRRGWLATRGRIPLGYYKDDEKTAATFPTDGNGVRWCLPGDYAIPEADGTITLLGRGSVSINTGGEKVFPEEVEGVLKGHPAVFDVLVVGVEDDRLGQRVVAVVEPRPESAVELDHLQQFARLHLAGFKVPRDLVVVDHITRTAAGKPDYRWASGVAAARLAPEAMATSPRSV